MPRPDVAFFLPSMVGGGAERATGIFAREFSEAGYTVDLVLMRATGPYLRNLAPGVRVVDLARDRVRQVVHPLARYLRREKPRTLVAGLPHTNVAAVTASLLARNDTPIIVIEHNTPTPWAADRSFAHRGILRLLVHWSYRRAAAVVAVSAGAADDLARFASIPRASITVIPNPVVTPDLSTRAQDSPGHPWMEGGGDPVVLSIGRLTRAKDHATLLRAFQLVRRERAVKLVILGEGEERAALMLLIDRLQLNDDVHLYGFTDNPYSFMVRASLLVLSSAWEGFGNVLVEAMALGTQVVSTDCKSGPSEILDRGRYGTLVPVGDPSALATAISVALDSPASPHLLQERASRFASATVARALLQVCNVHAAA